ncbi:hypothetical protein GQ607_001104 [Colletotrichum asianum]|uniref:Uncharacterized protein n=1 Tax=Colletotrichum asianum TaxID=702518 RepID=A0A8H3WRW7_9PEZI|nr:hypothetical protein GQ607_001104 [Colletotrichum asianum]
MAFRPQKRPSPVLPTTTPSPPFCSQQPHKGCNL